MQNRIHYTYCPLCGSQNISKALEAKDFTVSNELFTIMTCHHCKLRFTQDVPTEDAIGPYYKAEDYISHTNTSKGVINKMYQAVRNRTMDAKLKLVTEWTALKYGSLLDLGSGVGTFAAHMHKVGWNTTSLEPDGDARARAKDLYGLESKPAAELYSLSHGSYDAITLWHVLEHVHALSETMVQLRSLLKENGKLFIAVPNYTSLDAAIYENYWAAYDVPRHLYHFSPAAMEFLTEKHNLKLIGMRRMWYDSFYISLLSSRYKKADKEHRAVAQVRPNLVGAFWNGLRSNLQAMGDVKKCSSIVYIISR
jgi:2-polyprenyl-3-methyl-5-hydroxy-6-metoxy-1,4-benzoquinol methylase